MKTHYDMLGGPQLYVERFGHPRLRARHLPFAITSVERDQWMACMQQAMADTNVKVIVGSSGAAGFPRSINHLSHSFAAQHGTMRAFDFR